MLHFGKTQVLRNVPTSPLKHPTTFHNLEPSEGSSSGKHATRLSSFVFLKCKAQGLVQDVEST